MLVTYPMTAMWSVLGVYDGNDHRAVFVDCCPSEILSGLDFCVAHDLCDWDAHDYFHDCTV